MAKFRNFLYVVLSLILVFTISGCKDDLFGGQAGDYDGPTTITLDFSFHPLEEGLAMRGAASNLDFDISDLAVLFYEKNEREDIAPTFCYYYQTGEFTTIQEERQSTAERNTRHVQVNITDKDEEDESKKFKGRSFRIYAVANTNGYFISKQLESITEKQLRETKIAWGDKPATSGMESQDPKSYNIPNIMFGYFHTDGSFYHEDDYNHNPVYKDEEGKAQQDVIHHDTQLSYKTYNNHRVENRAAAITFDKQHIALHAWLKRVVSRLTVGFDGSQLNSGVEIYIKSVSVKDAVKECYLGHDNQASESGWQADSKGDERLNIVYETEPGAVGKAITYKTPAFPRPDDKEYITTKDDGNTEDWSKTWNKEWYEYVHGNQTTLDPKEKSTEAPIALYFMENMQGVKADDNAKSHKDNYSETTKDKYDKDDVSNGTYVEVEAYYRDTNKNSQGKIYYRFMLGQNTTNDFNAERNLHYKLILTFKGTANNPDWHIDYEEEEKNYYFRIPYNLDDDADDFAYVDTENDEHWYLNENWKQSYVWYAYDEEHNPIAEICKELVYYDAYGYKRDPRNRNDLGDNPEMRTFYQVVTIYPMDQDGDTDYTNGVIAQVLACDSDEPAQTYRTLTNGAKIEMCYRTDYNENVGKTDGIRGDCAIISSELTPNIASGVDENSHPNYYYAKYDKATGKITLIEQPLDIRLETRPYRVKDYDNNLYPIVKIGGGYWFRENLRTHNYNVLKRDVAETYRTISPYSSEGITPCRFYTLDYLLKDWYFTVNFNENRAMYKEDPKFGCLYNFYAIAGTIGSDIYMTWLRSYCGALLFEEMVDVSGYNDRKITPKDWHIPVGLAVNPGWYDEQHSDFQYLMDYMSDNLSRAMVNTKELRWPDIPNVKQPNLSGLSLLAIPADGTSDITFDLEEAKLKAGNLVGVSVPSWSETLFIDENTDNCWSFPEFLTYGDEANYGEKNVIAVRNINKNWKDFCVEISKQYLPVRPVRHANVFAPQKWDDIANDWTEVPNRNLK